MTHFFREVFFLSVPYLNSRVQFIILLFHFHCEFDVCYCFVDLFRIFGFVPFCSFLAVYGSLRHEFCCFPVWNRVARAKLKVENKQTKNRFCSNDIVVSFGFPGFSITLSHSFIFFFLSDVHLSRLWLCCFLSVVCVLLFGWVCLSLHVLIMESFNSLIVSAIISFLFCRFCSCYSLSLWLVCARTTNHIQLMFISRFPEYTLIICLVWLKNEGARMALHHTIFIHKFVLELTHRTDANSWILASVSHMHDPNWMKLALNSDAEPIAIRIQKGSFKLLGIPCRFGFDSEFSLPFVNFLFLSGQLSGCFEIAHVMRLVPILRIEKMQTLNLAWLIWQIAARAMKYTAMNIRAYVKMDLFLGWRSLVLQIVYIPNVCQQNQIIQLTMLNYITNGSVLLYQIKHTKSLIVCFYGQSTAIWLICHIQ